ncbi:MAG: hypothetical protein LAO31_18210 [Acidobacteriia bacterium]|nr:hypothetical protein [Terriglobia bacterium]
MNQGRSKNFKQILREFERHGLLLLSDSRLPSVSGLVAGEPVHGSWWGHPAGHMIFRMAGELADHADSVTAKLVSGKVTFVHRRLWSALFSVATSRQSWQMKTLPAAAKALLAGVDHRELLRSDHFEGPRLPSAKGFGKTVTELEHRLLIHSDEIHTETGAHARLLETWQHWAGRTDFKPKSLTPQQAKAQLMDLLLELNRRCSGNGLLPWMGE